MSLKGTWPQALWSFFLPLILVFCLRWLFFEPFVIPSGSMLPTLQIHDHVFVKKWSYGVRHIFSSESGWLWFWRQPTRGEVIVFKYPQNPNVFYIKRVIGLPGETVRIRQHDVYINDQKLQDPWGKYLSEETDPNTEEVYHVPADSYFVLGDNRDQSQDSRFWGFVPQDNLIGPAVVIWLSCEETLEASPMICDPAKIRWPRLFTLIQ
jgi:signal peptidase I